MKSMSLTLYLLLAGAAGWVVASQESLAETLPVYSRVYDPGRDPFSDGHAALKLAKATQRRVLIELGGDWCKWCHVLDDFLDKNPDLRAQLHETFVMLKVNVSDANSNEKFLAAFPKPLGYPHMYVADNNGQLLKSQDTAEFLQNGRYSRERFLRFFKRWQIKPEQMTAETANE